MSTGEKSSVDVSGLGPRIQSVKQDVLAVNQLLASGRRVRLVLILVVVVWLGLVAWTFVGMVGRVTSEEFRTELGNVAKPQIEGLAKQVQGEAEKFWNNSQPVLTEAFKKRLDEDTDKFSARIEEQRDLLQVNMQQRMQEELDKRYKKLVEDHRKLLEKEFPVVKDEAVHERMVENLAVAMHDLVEKYYAEEFKKQLDRLDKAWEDFPLADPAEKDQPGLADQLVAELIDLVPMLVAASKEPNLDE